MMIIRSALVGAMLVLGAIAAHAQSNWSTPGGSTSVGAVQMCLNSSGQAVPVSSGTCANPAQVTTTLSGTSGNNADAVAAVGTGLSGVDGYNFVYNGTTWDRARSINGALAAGTGTSAVAIAPTSSSAGGITAVVSAAAEATHVLKAGAGNLYSVYATNLTATAGFLTVINATSAPGDGAQTPLDCVPLPANGSASINFNPGPAKVYSTGITVIITSAATCFTKTTGVITAFISGSVQ